MHLASVLLVWGGCAGTGALPPGDRLGVTILRGRSAGSRTISSRRSPPPSAFTWPTAATEILFCVASPEDPVVLLVERLIAAHPGHRARLSSATTRSAAIQAQQPGSRAGRRQPHRWIVATDSNVLLPPDYLERLLGEWRADTGLVSSPAVGIAPEGFAAELECAFLNSYQARWQLAADAVGRLRPRQEPVLAPRRAGGWRRPANLGTEMAEDVAATKLVRRAGLKVRLVAPSPADRPAQSRRGLAPPGPLARVRRMGFRALYGPGC